MEETHTRPERIASLNPASYGPPRPCLHDICKLMRVGRKVNAIGFTGGPWEDGSPGFLRYVWYKDGATVYEGRLVNRELGQYKGYPLENSEWPSTFEGTDGGT